MCTNFFTLPVINVIMQHFKLYNFDGGSDNDDICDVNSYVCRTRNNTKSCRFIFIITKVKKKVKLKILYLIIIIVCRLLVLYRACIFFVIMTTQEKVRKMSKSNDNHNAAVIYDERQICKVCE